MRPLYEMQLIQIEITNACHIGCANCTRLVGHHHKPFFMSPEMVAQAIASLDGYGGHIGLMGGEPTLHPDFAEICGLFRKLIPDKGRRELWTSGHQWVNYQSIIMETFDRNLIAYNDHSTDGGTHQPLLVAAREVVADEDLMWALIDDCWVQNRWSASITPKGCFFCEVAAAMDHTFQGPGGYVIEPGWWKKDPPDFSDQVERYCPDCGGAVPLEKLSDKLDYDLVSPGNWSRLAGVHSPKQAAGRLHIFQDRLSVEEIRQRKVGWQPQNYRSFVAHQPGDYK